MAVGFRRHKVDVPQPNTEVLLVRRNGKTFEKHCLRLWFHRKAKISQKSSALKVFDELKS